MTRRRTQRLSRRARGVRAALAGTAAGTAALGLLAAWVDARRETDLADPSGSVTASFRHAGDVEPPAVRFRDVARELGITARHAPGPRRRRLPEDTGSGAAWGDVDGDGDLDLYLVSFSATSDAAAGGGHNRLYLQDEDGRFTDGTGPAGVGDPEGFGMGATFADYDGDGDLDLHVTNRGPNRLFRNRGDGTFEDVARDAGVDDPLWSTGAAWGDVDLDGDLDLYVCNYVDFSAAGDGDASFLPPSPAAPGGSVAYAVPFTLNPNAFDPQPNRLYLNDGEGTFEESGAAAGIDNPGGRSLAATFCDLDGDGWLDLYVNNDVSPNRLFRHAGEGGSAHGVPRFLDISGLTGTADPRGSMGLSVADVGSAGGGPDGLPDIFVTHWVAQENALYSSLRSGIDGLEYRDRARAGRLAEVSIERVGWGSAFVDLDLDGRLDIAVANGSTLERRDDPARLRPEPLFLFWNAGGRFQDVAPRAGRAASAPHAARGLAAADFDADGDVDLAVTVNRGRPLLLRNETPVANRSLTVALEGSPAARWGARVEVRSGGESQVRWWGADAGFLGGHAPDLVFGLGERDRAGRVEVLWTGGGRSVLEDVGAGRVVLRSPGGSGGVVRAGSPGS